MACVVWLDQCEAGVEFISIAVGEVRQLLGKGYFGSRSNSLRGPVFSSDGRFLAFTYGNGPWWSADGLPITPSLGGRHTVGWVVVGDVDKGTYREIEVDTQITEGWLPPDPEDMTHEMLGCPSFIDPDRFKVILPTGEERVFSASIAEQLKS
jgi:hypothetical protein